MTNVLSFPAACPVEPSSALCEARFAPTSLPGYPNGIPYYVPQGTPEDDASLVSEPALFARVSGAYFRECGEKLHRCRWDSPAFSTLGRYYTLSDRNNVTATDIDLEGWAKELGVLKPWERLEED